MRKGATCQGKATCKGTAHEGPCVRGGPHARGPHVREAWNDGQCNLGSKWQRCKVCASRARCNPGVKGAVHEWSGGVKMRQRDLVCSQVWEKGEGVQAGVGYNQVGGRHVNERRCALFLHTHTQ